MVAAVVQAVHATGQGLLIFAVLQMNEISEGGDQTFLQSSHSISVQMAYNYLHSQRDRVHG